MANERQHEGRPALDGDCQPCAPSEGGKKGPPPVHLWNPPFCGDLDMRIAADGTWFYLKTPIGRPALVKLFASVLKREGEKYFLVTPVEKVGITVDDAPVHGGRDDGGGQGRAGACSLPHQCRRMGRLRPDMRCASSRKPDTGGLKPYLHVRRDLWAQVTRALFYDLVELGEERDVEGGACSASRRAMRSSPWRRPTS